MLILTVGWSAYCFGATGRPGIDLRAAVARVSPIVEAAQRPTAPLPKRIELEPVTVVARKLAHANATDAELSLAVRTAPGKVGTASLGRPNRGGLFNGVPMPKRSFWRIETPRRSYTTPSVVSSLENAIRRVNERYPKTPKLGIGHASSEKGGYLRPHRSHQSGLDVDIGYYYLDGYAFYRDATKDNLDRPRTWELIQGLLGSGRVDYIFVDQSVRALLREHAESVGETDDHLDWVFGNGLRRGLLRHTWGHEDHIHVRFIDAEAVELGLRLYPVLVAAKLVR